MKKLLAITLTLFLTACASQSGKKFTISQANQVTNGMTREEVIKIMGTRPYSITNQGKTFTWSYAKVNVINGAKESRAVRFNFDDEGKTVGVPEGGVYGDTAKYLNSKWGIHEAIGSGLKNKHFYGDVMIKFKTWPRPGSTLILKTDSNERDASRYGSLTLVAFLTLLVWFLS